MAQVTNVSGKRLFVPSLGRTVDADETITVSGADLAGYVCQPGTWKDATPAPAPAPKVQPSPEAQTAAPAAPPAATPAQPAAAPTTQEAKS